jgi:hypothetical protein
LNAATIDRANWLAGATMALAALLGILLLVVKYVYFA